MRSRSRSTVAEVAAMLAGVALAAGLTGCGASAPPAPATVTVTVTPTPSPTAAPVGLEDLESLTAPAMCDRGSGRLVNGELPLPEGDGGSTRLATDDGAHYLYAEDPTAGGSAGEAGSPAFAVAFVCDGGTSSWPEVIGFYGVARDLLASYDLGDVFPSMHASVTDMAYEDGLLVVKWDAYDAIADSLCGGTGPDKLAAAFRVSDQGVEVVDADIPCGE